VHVREAVICEPVRTPVGRYGGVFKSTPVTHLAATVVGGVVARTGLTSTDVDDVIFGQGYANGEAAAIGRIAALDAGLDVRVPGLQIDRRCGSGLQAVLYACMQVMSGGSDLVLAGGAESMSQTELYLPDARWNQGGVPHLKDRLAEPRRNSGGTRFPVPGGMIETAENLRREYGISRTEQDEWAVRSHERAVRAIREGLFDDETIPVVVTDAKTREQRTVTVDEHPRPGTTVEKLGRLTPMLIRSDPDATVTAGNSSGQNDAAAACIVTTPVRAAELGLVPMLRLVSWAVAGNEPLRFGVAPVPAANLALARAGIRFDDLDVIELNEAFAVQVLACLADWDLDAEDPRLNPRGSGISIGHPIGATGIRMLATLAHELPDLDAELALETMCIGGGQALAAVFARV
jgi:acetyl-CoA C-acetyltransferase